MKRITPLILLIPFTVAPVFAQAPLVAYQGYLETGGTPLSGSHTLTFSLWAGPAGGVSGWSETHGSVPVTNGVFDVVLGSVNSLAGVDWLDYDYLQIAVNGTVLTPRTQLATVPYALRVLAPTGMVAPVETGHVLEVVNSQGTGYNYGLTAKTLSPHGIGVYGEVSATSGGNGLGVAGVSKVSSGASAGVYGRGPWGVWGESVYGPAILGTATSTAAAGTGVEGTSFAPFGVGVKGSALATTGPGRGVYGFARSTDGNAGYFEGGTAVYARSANNSTSDLVLAANDVTDDNGLLSSDPFYASSDLVMVAYDDAEIHLDENEASADEAGVFRIRNGANIVVFSVDETGNVVASGTITPPSDAGLKEDFVAVEPTAVLAELAQVPIRTWRYRGKPGRHIGPTAQDFRAAFGFGTTETGIATIDADGVALTAIQALYELVRKQQDELDALRLRLEAVER